MMMVYIYTNKIWKNFRKEEEAPGAATVLASLILNRVPNLRLFIVGTADPLNAALMEHFEEILRIRNDIESEDYEE